MEKKFVIVKFCTEDDSVAIISSKWLSEDRERCWYPDGPNVEKFVRKHASPALDWKEYAIKIMAEDVNYSDARRHLKKAEDTSNLDSDPDEYVKRKRNRTRRFSFEDSDEENEFAETNSKISKKSKISSYPSLDSFSNSINPPLSVSTSRTISSPTALHSASSSNSFPTTLNSVSTNPLLISVTTPTSVLNSAAPPTPLLNSIASPTPLLTSISSQLSPASFYSVPSQASEMVSDNRLVMMIGQIKSTVADLILEVREMGKKLDRALLNNSTNSDDTSENEMSIIGLLPLTTLELFDKFEELLKEANFRKLLVKVLISLGGREAKTVTYNMLRRLMSYKLAMHFSFAGKQPKNKDKEKKRAFCNTSVYKSIQDSVRKMYPDTKEDELKNYVSLWLQQAKHRQDRIREEN